MAIQEGHNRPQNLLFYLFMFCNKTVVFRTRFNAPGMMILIAVIAFLLHYSRTYFFAITLKLKTNILIN